MIKMTRESNTRMSGVAAQRVGKHWLFEIAKCRNVYDEQI